MDFKLLAARNQMGLQPWFIPAQELSLGKFHDKRSSIEGLFQILSLFSVKDFALPYADRAREPRGLYARNSAQRGSDSGSESLRVRDVAPS